MLKLINLDIFILSSVATGPVSSLTGRLVELTHALCLLAREPQ